MSGLTRTGEDSLEIVREALRSMKKSPLQIRLESEGWIHRSNHQIYNPAKDDFHSLVPTVEELERTYTSRGEEVRFEQAFDNDEHPLPREDYVAVYVKPGRR
ncbi:MAG: hypothetical protein Q8P81_04235 [Nanoarchaeota archaeon]|nr:hypothetical protein [Nanoarchaeota archaeon]